MGVIKLNGKEYGGGGGAEVTFANGLFIDTNNVIVPETRYTGSVTYTATEDCAVTFTIANSANSSADVTLDGEPISVIFGVQINLLGDTIFVKKGQTLVIRTSFSSADVTYKVYGIQPASNVTFIPDYASACYSTTEREVGCWTDGKPLYQKTFELGTLASGQNVGKSLGLANIDKIFLVTEGSWFIDSGTHFPIPYVHYATGNLVGILFEVSASDVMAQFRIGSGMSGAIGNTILTVRYTKTTDVAGSGNWTPLGKPTVHYSTEEQVIGTWIDGKPLYEKTIVYTPSGTITSSVTIATIANAKVMRIMEATGYNATDNRGYNLPDVRSSGGTKFTYDNGDVVIQTINDSWDSSWTFYVTVQYTKTTD